MARAPRSSQDDIFLSKQMAYILRHGAGDRGLQLHPDGYLFVDDLLKLSNLRKFSQQDVRRVVEQSDKQRFQIEVDAASGRMKVRASQGHTLNVPEFDMPRITNPADAPIVVHGTSMTSWRQIEGRGLSKMRRNHIHFAIGEPGADGVVSGMPNSSEVCIYVNMKLALQDGIKFFRSTNNVILSPGDEQGLLLPKYFEKVMQRHSRVQLK